MKDYTSKFVKLGTILIEHLKNHPSSPPFLLPVENIPFYHDIIKYPMDISTAEKKIKSGQYDNKIEELVRDIRQIFQNCYIFNQDESYISKQCKKLEMVFEEVIIPKILQLAKKINFPIQANLDGIEPLYRRKDLNPSTVPPPTDPIKINLSSNKNTNPLPKIPSIKLDRKHSVRTKPQSTSTAPSDFNPPLPENNNKNIEKVPTSTSVINNDSIINSKNELKLCRKVINKLLKHYDAMYFREPVDPVLYNIPTYFTIVKNPMDLGTIKKKIEGKEYKNKADFEYDVRLVFSNCFLFNPPGTPVNDSGKSLESYFNKEWIDTFGDIAMGKEELKLCNRIISKLQKHKSATPFLLPVDRNIYPQYYELIPKPMDLSTLKTKLNKGKYDKVSKFESDTRLIFRNCYTFNDSSSFLSQQAHILESYFNKEMSYDLMKSKENVHTEEEKSSIKIRQSMSPEPMERTKTVISLKNSIPENEVKESSSKSRKLDDENMDEKEKSKLNSTRSINNAAEVSSKRVKKDNGGHDNDNIPPANADTKDLTMGSKEYHKCQVLTKKMQKHKYGIPFLEPVDPVALNIPTYFTIIKHPMDLSTIDTKLSKKKYTSLLDYYKDVDLMFRNCFKFNLPNDYVYQAGKSLQAFFEKEWINARLPPVKLLEKKSKVSLINETEPKKKVEERESERERDYNTQSNKALERESSMKHSTENSEDTRTLSAVNKKHKHDNKNLSSETKSLSPSIKNQLLNIIHKMQNHSCSRIFLEPVDPKQFPDYHKFIHNPMDLSTIKKKLEKNKYQTIEDFRSDILLIFSNCNIYNPPGSWAQEQGQKLEEFWHTLEKSLSHYEVHKSHDGRSMSMIEVKVCESIIRKMLRNPNSYPFKDSVPDTVPMYHDIIKKPMDFTTLKNNLDHKKYASLEEFHSDLTLIFKNCYTFNMEGSDLFVAAQVLEEAFNELWNRRHDLLRQATEKLAQKGYNIKHLKHRSSTLNVNNTEGATTTTVAGDDANANQKSKVKVNSSDIASSEDTSKLQRTSSISMHSSTSKTKLFPNNKKEKLSSLPNFKLKSSYSHTKDAEKEEEKEGKDYYSRDRKHNRKHHLGDDDGDDDDNDNYSLYSTKEYRNKKKKTRYNSDDGSDGHHDDMDVEYQNSYNTKKSHDTNLNGPSSRHSRPNRSESHHHRQHSSSSFSSRNRDENSMNQRNYGYDSKNRSSSHLKQSFTAHDDDDDDDNPDSQNNIKIKIKI